MPVSSSIGEVNLLLGEVTLYGSLLLGKLILPYGTKCLSSMNLFLGGTILCFRERGPSPREVGLIVLFSAISIIEVNFLLGEVTLYASLLEGSSGLFLNAFLHWRSDFFYLFPIIALINSFLNKSLY